MIPGTFLLFETLVTAFYRAGKRPGWLVDLLVFADMCPARKTFSTVFSGARERF